MVGFLGKSDELLMTTQCKIRWKKRGLKENFDELFFSKKNFGKKENYFGNKNDSSKYFCVIESLIFMCIIKF